MVSSLAGKSSSFRVPTRNTKGQRAFAPCFAREFFNSVQCVPRSPSAFLAFPSSVGVKLCVKKQFTTSLFYVKKPRELEQFK